MRVFSYSLLFSILFFNSLIVLSQNEIEPLRVKIFNEQLINFGGEVGDTTVVKRLQNGRVVYKKVTVPEFKKGTDVSITLKLRSNGDRWDKSGSCFVVTNPEQIDLIDVALKNEKFPAHSGIGDELGVKRTENYAPAVELMRFMTPFGVGYYSDEGKHPNIKYGRPVYVPKWEDEVIWKTDISDLATLVTGTFYIGVWIDTWTAEGYMIDMELQYSGRPRPKLHVLPLFNTVYYVDGQKIPELFVTAPLAISFKADTNIKDATLHYITTGHGGHSGGDEFIKIENSIYLDTQLVWRKTPWRDERMAQ